MEFLRQLRVESEDNNITFYLVGGFLRDRLAGLRSVDLDLTGPPGSLSFAAAFAKKHKINGQLIARHGVLRLRWGRWSLDISEFKGENIREDLALRDFTINAMALPLASYLEEGVNARNLIDPFGGLVDFTHRTLQALPGAFAEDPLRIMRAARLALRLGFLPGERTIHAAKSAAGYLTMIPGERIVTEILTVLKGKSVGYLPLLETFGATVPVFSKRFTLRSDFVTEQTEFLLNEAMWPHAIQKQLSKHLNRPMAALTRGRHIIKFGALLCDLDGIEAIRKDTLKAVKRLPLARSQSEALYALAEALSMLACSRKTGFSKKEIYHYFNDFGPFGVDAAILTCALRGPRARPAASRLIWEYFSPSGQLASPQQYITGWEAAAMVGKAGLPSHRTGQLQDALRRAAALGEIVDKEEAESFAAGFIAAIVKYLS